MSNNTTEQKTQTELNFWSSCDILCQAVEAAQTKGGVYNLKDAAILSQAVDIVRASLAKIIEQSQTQPADAAQAESQPAGS